ncbi:VOC family protein [Jiulongibacter sediminis]|jgi:PhnB protein|uniref:VOC family protein n=1 Tax=Jiulongibacter sediminis TaxID=1605367 RepID=UPI0026EC0014|nr:VOC family protein [Jiulongibacter sediminis]
MASVSIYLNFPNKTEEAFNFYKEVFQTEFIGPISRFSDVPPEVGSPSLPEEALNGVMHVELPITAGFKLMGTDAPECMGFNVIQGNNVNINLMPDTRKETERLFKELSTGGVIRQELQDMFWGDYYGSLTDKFGIQWMFNCSEKK